MLSIQHNDFSFRSYIFCDMDGVLADFERGTNAVLKGYFGKTYDEIEAKKPNSVWAYLKTIPNFWRDLPPKDDFLRLWAFIRPFRPYILSARPKSMPEGKSGKLDWLSKHLPEIPESRIIICLRAEKPDYAMDSSKINPNILIDDDAGNIKNWRLAGGIGILHTSANQTISELRKLRPEPV